MARAGHFSGQGLGHDIYHCRYETVPGYRKIDGTIILEGLKSAGKFQVAKICCSFIRLASSICITEVAA